MPGFMRIAELHCQDILDAAARYRLALQDQPIQPTAKEALVNTLRTVRTFARNALSPISFLTLSASVKERDQRVLTAAR